MCTQNYIAAWCNSQGMEECSAQIAVTLSHCVSHQPSTRLSRIVQNHMCTMSAPYTHDSILTTPYSRSILTTPHCRLHTHECTLSQVGVDPRLRDLARQLLLAVTNAEAVEEAVLVLMTDAAADTATQVVLAAEQLTPMLQQGPAAQALLLLFFACCSSTSSSHAGWFMQSFLVTVEGSGRM